MKPHGPMAMTKLKNELVRIDPQLKVELRNIRVNGQLMGCSGFVTNPDTGRIAYVSTESGHGANAGRALYRTAESTRDFTGGANRFAAHDAVPRAVVDLVSS